MVDVTYPILPRFHFKDQSGKMLVLDSPELHRFLLTMYKRTGGTSDTIDANSGAISDIETDTLSLTTRVGLVEDRADDLEDRADELEYKVAVLELQQALIEDR